MDELAMLPEVRESVWAIRRSNSQMCEACLVKMVMVRSDTSYNLCPVSVKIPDLHSRSMTWSPRPCACAPFFLNNMFSSVDSLSTAPCSGPTRLPFIFAALLNRCCMWSPTT